MMWRDRDNFLERLDKVLKLKHSGKKNPSPKELEEELKIDPSASHIKIIADSIGLEDEVREGQGERVHHLLFRRSFKHFLFLGEPIDDKDDVPFIEEMVPVPLPKPLSYRPWHKLRDDYVPPEERGTQTEESELMGKEEQKGEKESVKGEKEMERGEKETESGEKDMESGEKDTESGEKDTESGEKDKGETKEESGKKEKDKGKKEKESAKGARKKPKTPQK